jgi:hypothetical protein
VLVSNEHGQSDVEEYLLDLTKRRTAGSFQATSLLAEIGRVQKSGDPGQPVRIIDAAINIHILQYEEHIVAYGTLVDPPSNPEPWFLLTAFRERDLRRGLDRAEQLARRLCRPDTS